MRSLPLVMLVVGLMVVAPAVLAQQNQAGPDRSPLFGVWEGKSSGGQGQQMVTVTIVSNDQVMYTANSFAGTGVSSTFKADILVVKPNEIKFKYTQDVPGGSLISDVYLKLKEENGIRKLVGYRDTPNAARRYLNLTYKGPAVSN